MTRTLWKLAFGTSLAVLTFPTDIFAGRGGGRGGGGGGGMQRGGGGEGGGMQRGGGEGGGMQRGGGEGGGMQRGGGGGGMQRGGGGGGGMQRGGGGGGGMSHSPSFSQPRPQTGGSSSDNRNPNGRNAGAGGRNASASNPNGGAAAAGAANRNQNPNAGAAAAGAGNANRNQNPNGGAAAAGAGAANRNQNPNAGAAAAGADYANRNQPGVSNAGAAAAGAGYSNRNQSQYPNAGAAAAGAGYANRNQNQYPNAGAAAAGAAYANNNGYWNGNYGNGSLAAYGGMAAASPSYGYGSTPYMNPYAGSGGGGQAQPANAQPANAPAGDPQGYDYSQPVNAAATPADVPPPADPATTPAAQARQAFQAGDYAGATRLTRQALAQTPNDVDLHQSLALDLFAQGSFEQAAAPLYAVLAAGPGWDWTTLIGNYPDADVYTGQLRGLEAFVKANPRSAQAQFLLAYHYISQGQESAAIRPLENVVSLQPADKVSAQLLEHIQPGVAAAPAQPLDSGKMSGVWVAQAPPNAKITLSMSDDANFTWAIAAPGKPPVTITGTYTLSDGVLTLAGRDAPGGPLAGRVAATDDNHMNFKAVGSPSSDPGLQFAR